MEKEVTVMIVRKIQKELAELAREYKVVPGNPGKLRSPACNFPITIM